MRLGGLLGGSELDALFREAVAAVDAGDVDLVGKLIAAHPELVRERLEVPGAWLRDVIGKAADGFFERPYLLWFAAEDPVRHGKLPSTIATVAQVIIDAARRGGVASLQKQLDYALSLVSWSWIARESGVQIALIDVLVDAGAKLTGNSDNALVNGNRDAAAHLVARGAPLTLATALALDLWDDVDRLLLGADEGNRRFALVLAALNGRVEALRFLIGAGVDVNAVCKDLYSHATPLHHAVSSGSLEAVRLLVSSGAGLEAKDTAWSGTPLGWALHGLGEAKDDAGRQRFSGIADLLRSAGSRG